MLNPFPGLLDFGILAPMLIRIAIGAALFYVAIHHYRSKQEIKIALSPLIGKLSGSAAYIWAGAEILVGVLLIVGAWTQYAAIVASIMAIKSLMLRKQNTALLPLSHSTYLLLLVMSLSLLVSGAGGFAFDLPL